MNFPNCVKCGIAEDVLHILVECFQIWQHKFRRKVKRGVILAFVAKLKEIFPTIFNPVYHVNVLWRSGLSNCQKWQLAFYYAWIKQLASSYTNQWATYMCIRIKLLLLLIKKRTEKVYLGLLICQSWCNLKFNKIRGKVNRCLN